MTRIAMLQMLLGRPCSELFYTVLGVPRLSVYWLMSNSQLLQTWETYSGSLNRTVSTARVLGAEKKKLFFWPFTMTCHRCPGLTSGMTESMHH